MSGMFILLFPLIATIIVFLIAVYAESMRLEIPLSYGGVRGVGGRYPLKFFYVSNIPVILTAALLANVQMLPAIVGINIQNPLPYSQMNSLQQAVTTFVQYVTIGQLSGTTGNPGILNPANIFMLANPQIILHLIIYLTLFLLLCILFGKFWVETTGLGADRVAEQIQQGGMQIPGFRRDQRVVERVLNRYIPQITIIRLSISRTPRSTGRPHRSNGQRHRNTTNSRHTLQTIRRNRKRTNGRHAPSVQKIHGQSIIRFSRLNSRSEFFFFLQAFCLHARGIFFPPACWFLASMP